MEHPDVTLMAKSGAVRRQAIIASFGVLALMMDHNLDALFAARK